MKKKKTNKSKNSRTKVILLSSLGVIVCILCFIISLTSGEEYSNGSSDTEQLDDDNVLEVATKEAGEVSDDKRVKPATITIDEYLDAYQKEENTVVLFSRDTCEYCKLAIPILENIIYENHVDLKYIDLATLSDEDKNKLSTSNEYFKEGVSTPLLIVIGNGEIKDQVEGLVTKESYITFFQKYGFME